MNKPTPKYEMVIERTEGESTLLVTYANPDVKSFLDTEIKPMCEDWRDFPQAPQIMLRPLKTYDQKEVLHYIRSAGNTKTIVRIVQDGVVLSMHEE